MRKADRSVAPPGAVRIGDPFGSADSYDRLLGLMRADSRDFQRRDGPEADPGGHRGKARVNAPPRRRAFVIATLALVACVAALAFLGPWREAPGAGLALFLAAGAAWWGTTWCAERTPPAPVVVCAVALLLRVLALASHLELSDDAYRYVWEGELVTRGISPYAWSPDDPALAAVRAERSDLFPRVSHPEVPAVYPPLVQGCAALAVQGARVLDLDRVDGPISILRVFLSVVDLLVLWPLVRLARGSGRPSAALVAWGFSPLVAFECAGSAHFDVLGIACLLAALAALARADVRPGAGRDAVASGWLAAAIAVKYLPVLVLPWPGTRARAVRRIGLTALCVALSFAPFLFLLGGDRGFLGGLSHYRDRWEAASLVFRFVHRATAAVFEPSDGWTDPGRLARALVALAWLAWAILVVVRVRERVRGAGLLIAGYLVLTPTLHPWYLVWMLPFVAWSGSRAWTWLVVVAPVLYAPIATWQLEGRWIEPAWVWPVVALPFFALLILGARIPRRAPAPPGEAVPGA